MAKTHKLTKAEIIGVVGGGLTASISIALAKTYSLALGFIPVVLIFIAGYYATKMIVNKILKNEITILYCIKEEDNYV